MADVITTGQMLWPWVNVHFNLSSGMLYRTSSHICGRWYLPTFLFRDGPTQQNNTPRPHITVPYYRGLSESIKQRCKNYRVQVYFRGGTMIKNLLMAPKDLDPMLKKSGVIYSYKCGRVECNEEYIGDPQGPLKRGSRNIKRPPLPYLTILTPLVTA